MEQELQVLIQSRVFAFGDYASHAYGCLCFDPDGSVRASFEHERESYYRFQDGFLELLFVDALAVTARFVLVRQRPMLFHGSSVGLNNSLYLVEALALDGPPLQPISTPLRPPVLINTVPKAGTYYLQRAFMELGYSPTDLHLGNRSLHDNRGLPRDAAIHGSPRLRQVDLEVGLLIPFFGSGSVTVAHIDDRSVLHQFTSAGVCVIAVVRDLRAILWSLFRFKSAAVDPVDANDRRWRSCDCHLERFMGFLAYQFSHDLVHIRNCFRSFAALTDVSVLRYEDLIAGSLPEAQRERLETVLRGCGGAEGFLAAVAAARDAPTPTLTSSLPGLPALTGLQEDEIRRLIDAVVAGSELAELNALFGYA